MEIWQLTASQLKEAVKKGEVGAREVWEAYRRRIAEVDPLVKAYITVLPEFPAEAHGNRGTRDFETCLAETPEGLLEGVPFAVKDNICTRGLQTTCGSRILEGFVPPFDATVVTSLRKAGALILGKTNMDEFAMGSSCENSGFFPTRNPWDLGRVPGGSSGGSAAAVAADEAAFALGSDTGGSVRQPASLCGVVGMKPTYGRVSRYGLVAFASSLDQIGPIAKDVADCALVLNAIAGHDVLDSTSAPVARPDFTLSLIPDVRGLKLGLPKEYMAEGIEPGVRDAIHQAVSVLLDMGAIVEECSLRHTEYGLSAYYIIAPAEASSNLARYDGVKYGHRRGYDANRRSCGNPWPGFGAPGGPSRLNDAYDQREDLLEMYGRTRREGFGPEVKRRIILGTYALSSGYYDAYYLKAQKVRTLIRRDFDEAFRKYDALISPTSPTVAFRIGEKVDDPLTMYLSDVCTIPVNLAGLPAISVPCGFDQGLPIGLQIIGRAYDEGTILRIAYAFEQATEWHRKRPGLRDSSSETVVRQTPEWQQTGDCFKSQMS